ncbi:hypothetical protein SCAR479_06894 [Seiridium cardinale]|uniref:Uncharacterized protein n=1 Tax=Seiridium cardinale TaxID=138064 RepID=A0ABR2XRX3_9PEZI
MSTEKASTKLDTLPIDVLRQIQASFVRESDMVLFWTSISKKIHNALDVVDLFVAAAKKDPFKHEIATQFGLDTEVMEELFERDRDGVVVPDLLSRAVRHCRDLGVVRKAVDCYQVNCPPAIFGHWCATSLPGKQLALLDAAEFGRPDVVKMLLDAGSDIADINHHRQPFSGSPVDALMLAAWNQHEQTVLYLIERGAVVRPGHLKRVASLKLASLLKYMLNKFKPRRGLARNNILRSILDMASTNRIAGAVDEGSTEVMDVLFDAGLDLTGDWHARAVQNAAEASCLKNAVYLHLFFRKHNVEQLESIWRTMYKSLRMGADHVLQGIKFLYSQHMEILYDETHKNVDEIGSELLWAALNSAGHISDDIDEICDSWSACHEACTYLIEKGCKPEFRHLQVATFWGYTYMIDQCVEKGLSVNMRQPLPKDITPTWLAYGGDELTPLEHALTGAWTNINFLRGACRLVFHGANIDDITESVYQQWFEIYMGAHWEWNVFGMSMKDALKKARSGGIRPDRSRVTGQGEKDDLLDQLLVIIMIILKV